MGWLLVAPFRFYPPTHGGARRILQVAEALSRRGALEVLVFDTSREPGWHDVDLPFPCRTRLWGRPAATRALPLLDFLHPDPWVTRTLYAAGGYGALRQAIDEARPDLVVFEYSWSCPSRLPPIPFVVDEVNLEWSERTLRAGSDPVPAARAKYAWTSWILRRAARRRYRRAAAVWTVSPTDAEAVRALSPKTTVETITIPAPDPPPARPRIPHSLIFTGFFGHPPNREAIRFALDRLWPLLEARAPEARFLIVGYDPPPWLRERVSREPAVELTANVPDVRESLSRAAVAIAPIFTGTGLRTKLLEAFACRTPVVTTRLGAEGLDLTEGEHVLFAQTAEEFSGAILRLWQDDGLRARLAAAGLRLARENHDRERLANRILEAAGRIAVGDRRTPAGTAPSE